MYVSGGGEKRTFRKRDSHVNFSVIFITLQERPSAVPFFRIARDAMWCREVSMTFSCSSPALTQGNHACQFDVLFFVLETWNVHDPTAVCSLASSSATSSSSSSGSSVRASVKSFSCLRWFYSFYRGRRRSLKKYVLCEDGVFFGRRLILTTLRLNPCLFIHQYPYFILASFTINSPGIGWKQPPPPHHNPENLQDIG